MPVAKNHFEQNQIRYAHHTLKMPHPAVLIIFWASLIIATQSLQATALLLAGLPVLVVAYAFSATHLAILLRRTRWIMFSLLIIYAYATPGVAVWGAFGQFSPTFEGLTDGLMQLFRLAFALAGLAILLGLLSQAQLIGGLYALAYPLRYLGLSRERIAVRLALTLEYAESAILDRTTNWRTNIEQMLAPAEIKQESIELHVTPFTLRDGLLLILAGVLLLRLWL